MKNRIITVILVILLLIPSVVAIVNYSIQQKGGADTHNTVKVTLTDTVGNEYAFDRENGKEMIDYFLSAITNAVSIGSLPTTVEEGAAYQVVLTTAVSDFGYKFYYSESCADCYFVNGNGEAYKLTEADAQSFLDGSYCADIYENGLAPVLSVSGTRVSPDYAEWKFVNGTGQYVSQDTSVIVKNEEESLSLEGGLAMNFTTEPDSLTVKVTDMSSGDVLFNDLYDSASGMNISGDMKVRVEAMAKWYEDSARSYYGEQNYVFTASLTAAAQFFAGVTDVQIGEFICITGYNISNVDNIGFTSTPDINYTPVFYDVGDKVLALIPMNWDLSAGEYALNFTYGGSGQQININLSQRSNPFRDGQVSISNAVINSFGTEEVLKKCESTMLEVAKTGEAKVYFDKSFGTGAGDATIVAGFGHTYKVSGTSQSFRHTGVDYKLTDGSDITAVNNGKVIYAGYTDYAGYTVVIEHGLGLKSWYAHLSKTNVEVGAEVKKGDKIGEAGSSGFIASSGVHVGLTVFDVPVCQYALWDDGSRCCIPIYTAEN